MNIQRINDHQDRCGNENVDLYANTRSYRELLDTAYKRFLEIFRFFTKSYPKVNLELLKTINTNCEHEKFQIKNQS